MGTPPVPGKGNGGAVEPPPKIKTQGEPVQAPEVPALHADAIATAIGDAVAASLREAKPPVVNVTMPDTALGIADAIKSLPQPIVNVTVPTFAKRGVEVTTVTKHDGDGRILEYERREVEPQGDPQ
jgi:hypothetical protein